MDNAIQTSLVLFLKHPAKNPNPQTGKNHDLRLSSVCYV